jgi:hypothetical protein
MANGEPEKKYFDVARPVAKRTPPLNDELASKKIIPLLEDVTNDSPPTDAVPVSGAPFRPDSLMEPESAETKEGQPEEVSHAGFTITPLPDKNQESTAAEEPSAPNEADEPVSEDKSGPNEPVVEAQPELEEKVETELGVWATESVPTAETEPDKPQKLIATEAEPSADTGPEDSATGSGGQDAKESVDKDVPIPEEQFASADITEDPGKKVAEAAKAEMQEPKIYDTKEYYVPIGKMHHKHGSKKGAFVFGVICAVVVVATTVCVMYKLGQ